MVLLSFASNTNEWQIVMIKLQTAPETLTNETELNELTVRRFAIAVFELTSTEWDTMSWTIACIVMAPRRPTLIPARNQSYEN